jgi:PKD repeat protein
MRRIIISIIIVGLFIGLSFLPAISSLNSEANNSDSHNTEYIEFDDNRQLIEVGFIPAEGFSRNTNDTNGPLGEWPDFSPIGFITAPHPDYPEYQTHLYGDWGSIVGEEFIFLQDSMIKLLYHSYHETYMTQRVYEYAVLDNWSLGYDPVTKIKLTPLVKPGGPIPGPAYLHTDTPSYIHHPITREHLIYNTVRPGTKDEHPEWVGIPGTESAIQVATSTTPPAMATPFNQTYENMLVAEYWWEQGWNQNGEIKGGLSEPTAVWIPHLGKVRLFYRGLNGAVGNYWTWRISYADSVDGKTNWVKKGTATFDPSVPGNPGYDIWEQTGFRGAWQAHVTGDPRAGGVHMVLTVSNQNYAGGGRISYFWSPDWGDTWIAHPLNPILIPGTHPNGVPANGFQRTPTLLIDEEYGRYILAYNAGNDINEKWKRRTYIATATRPAPQINNPPEIPTITGPNYGITGQNHTYYSNSTDPDGDYIYYWFDWGDGTSSGYVGPYISGGNGTASHKWNFSGSYNIKIKAKDIFGLESGWSDNLTISINSLPIANFSFAPLNPTTQDFIQFNDTSTDSDGSIVNWTWDFGDGYISYSQHPIHQYNIAGNYTVCLTVLDDYDAVNILCKSLSVNPSGTINVNITLKSGWNLITISVKNVMWASDLAENISGCLSVSGWDNFNQTYKTYIVGGPPSFDFQLMDGLGYFVDVTGNTSFISAGLAINVINVSLNIGWNLIGWYHDTNTLASSIAENITSCLSVSGWDSTNQTYKTFIFGGPPSFDFMVSLGMGLFVDVTQQSYWYGEG